MSLTIKTLEDGDAGGVKVTVDRRLWLTADRKRAVEDGDPKARFQLCAPGKRVLRSELERVGVKIKSGKKKDAAKSEEPAENKADAPADNKTAEAPADTKAPADETAAPKGGKK